MNTEKDPKKEGRVEPHKLSKEELEKRKETGYKNDEASRGTPSEKGVNPGAGSSEQNRPSGNDDLRSGE